jgi:hypothetical protein
LCGLILTVVTTAYLTTAFIQGRHRTGEKLTQETNTTNTSNTTPTNIIQVHSALQLRTEPQLHSKYTGNPLEPFQMGNNFTVWWAKLKICLKDTPNNQWAQQAIMSIDDKVLNKLGGDISRYIEAENGFEQLRQDLEDIQVHKQPVTLGLYAITNRRQRKHESLVQFGKAIRQLARDIGRIEERELQNVFCRGLLDPELRREVTRNMYQKHPANLEEVVDYASSTDEAWRHANEALQDDNPSETEVPRKQLVKFQQQGHRGYPPTLTSERNPHQDLRHDTNTNKHTEQRLMPTNRSFPNNNARTSQGKNDQVQCYSCQGYGHVQRECPLQQTQ